MATPFSNHRALSSDDFDLSANFLTLLALIAITIYWSLHYTWNSALIDVSERFGVAQNSVTLLQQKQANHVRAFAESYDFRKRLQEAETLSTLPHWVQNQKSLRLRFLKFWARGLLRAEVSLSRSREA